MSKVLKIPVLDALEHRGVKSITDGEWLQDYAADNANSFLKEWASDAGVDEVPEEVQQAVEEAIWENIGRSAFGTEANALVNAVENLAEESSRAVGVREAVLADFDEKRGMLKLTVSQDFLRIWRAATEGYGTVAWDPSLRMKDVTAKTVLSVLDDMAKVYDWWDIQRRIEASLERFEPDTGSHWQLKKIAEAAMRAA
jgi:hypothetical protein